MTKQDLIKTITAKGGKCYKSWTIAKLQETLKDVAGNLSYSHSTWDTSPSGNWNTAKDWFPTIEIDQAARHIQITTYDSSGHQKKASVSTEWINVNISDGRDQVFVRGEVDCRNWINGKCSGSQKFCFAIFVGDDGHIYTHRATASKGWMEAAPDTIRKRLRKLGIGAVNVIQQGDFLLKPANGNALPDAEFDHEYMGSGHHRFELPVLRSGGQVWIQEPTKVVHRTNDDTLRHPDITVPPGKYIVGTTAQSLNHSNMRD
jgi:hypothetical protein